MRTELRLKRALAKQKSCFWPWDKNDAVIFSFRGAAAPSALPRMTVHNPTLLNTSTISSSVWTPRGSALNRIVSVKRNGSWVRQFTLRRIAFRGTLVMSLPSRTMRPSDMSTIRRMAWMSELLPLPLLPQRPSFVPWLTENDTSRRIGPASSLQNKSCQLLRWAITALCKLTRTEL